jgi:short-subunit dehydrogenase
MDTCLSTYQSNLIDPLRLTQLRAPLLVHTAARPDWGRTVIFNVSSIGGRCPKPWGGVHESTKSATESLSETLRYEMRPLDVAVYCGLLGILNTAIISLETNPFDANCPTHLSTPIHPHHDQTIS